MTLTSTDFEPIVTAFSTNVPVVLTAGLGIAAITLIAYFVLRFVRRAAR